MEASTELDLLIAAQESRVNLVTTRSAILTTASVLGGSIISAQVQAKIDVNPYVVGMLGAATLAGIVVLLGTRLLLGPSATKLVEWATLYPAQLPQLLMLSKAMAHTSNEVRVRYIDRAFYVQALIVSLSIVVALADTRGGVS